MTKKTETKKDNRPIIETILNTCALAVTATGTAWLIDDLSHKGMGFVLILFGATLEFFKYWGRKHKLW